MGVKLIKIGNSKGIRIPKEFLHGFSDDLQFHVVRDGEKLVLTPEKDTRKNWVDQMKQERSQDEDEFVLNEFDENDWEWK